jgi:GTPase
VGRLCLKLDMMVTLCLRRSDSIEQGSTMNLSENELMIAYDTLVKVAATLDADCCLIHKKNHVAGGWMGIVMMRNRSDTVEALEIRVACMYLLPIDLTLSGVGNVDAGKSTLLGTSSL